MRRFIAGACTTALVVAIGCGMAQPGLAAPNGAIGVAPAGSTARISGAAFITAMGGEAVTCAGREVTLVPATAHPVAAGFNDDDLKTAIERAAPNAALHARCDAAGQFAVNGLAARDWIVTTSITWAVPAKHGTLARGGILAREIALQPGTNTLVLSNADLH